MNDITKIAKDKLESLNGFIKANNYKVLKVEQNYCKMEGIITDTSVNHMNIAHGGYIFGLADTAGGIAAMSEGDNVVTIDANINYLKKATGSKIYAIAKVLKRGKHISVYEVLINNKDDELIAKATMTYCVI